MQRAECIEVLRIGRLWGLMAGLSGVTASKRSPVGARQQQHLLFSETRSSARSLDHTDHKLPN